MTVSLVNKQTYLQMKAREMPEGFEKVLQFNVYMRGGEGRDPHSDVRYTVAEDYAPRVPRDSVEKTGRETGRPSGYKDRSIEDLSPEDVGDIRSFLHRVKSETGDGDTRRTYEQPRDPLAEDTMFKPRNRDRTDNVGEMTQEKTPDRGGYERKGQTSPEDYYLRNEDNGRLSPSFADDRRSPQKEQSRPSDRYDDQRKDKDDGRYLEIFVRPKRGQEKLVYRENGEPAEVVHRFTPRRDYDRYNEEPDQRSSQRKTYDEPDYRNDYRKPELYLPSSSHKKYVPKNEDDYPRTTTENRSKRGSAISEQRKDPYKERPDEIRVSDYDVPKQKTNSSGPYSNHPIPPEEAYARYSRVDGPRGQPSDADRQYNQPVRDRSRQPSFPEDRYPDRPIKESRGRYPDDLVDDPRSYKNAPMDDDERRRYQERQKELIDALYQEKNALKELVDRLCYRLDHEEPQGRAYPEYEPSQRPRDEYVNVPPLRNSSPSPRPEWHPGPYKNPRDRNEILSKSERKSPFDVDKKYGRTEWEMSEPYLKQYDKLGKSPTRNTNASPREYSRSPAPNRFERTAPPRVNTYSPVRDSPKAGDEFCGLCDVYLDKDKFRKDMADRGRNPSVDRFNEGGNNRGKVSLI